MLSCLLANTLLAAVAALFVLAIARWGQAAPAVLHALWLVVLLKLLSPFGLVYPLPLGFDSASTPAHTQAREPATAPQPVHEPIEVAEEVFFLAALPADAIDGPPNSNDANVQHSVAPPPRSTPAASGPNVLGLLMLVWAAGAGCVAGWQIWQTWCFARRMRRARPAPETIIRHVARLARQLNMRAPAVRVLPGLASPVVWALGRPVLLWPAGLEERLADGGRDAVLLHELAHLRRGDHWTRWLELAAAIIHWWNPLFWLARRQVRFQAELACDAWVTGTLPGGRRDYAEALLEVCSTVARAAAPSPAVGVGGDGRRDFQRRLTMIMRDQVPCRLSGRGKLAVALLAATLLPGWVFAQEEGKKTDGVEAEIFLVGADGDSERDKRLKALEQKINELTKELQALRGDKPAPASVKGPIRVELRRTEVKPMIDVLKPVPATAAAPEVVIIRVIDKDTGKIIKEYREQAQPQADMIKRLTDLQKEAVKQAAAARDAEKIARMKAEEARAEATKKLGDSQGRVVERMKEIHLRLTNPTEGAQAILLSRATYKLPKDKAQALGEFIKAHVKAQVLEIKIEGEQLTVTTTPELQTAIGTLVNLMSGKAPTSALTPSIRSVPATFTAPAQIQFLPDSGKPDNIQFFTKPLNLNTEGLKMLVEPLKLDAEGIKVLIEQVAPRKPNTPKVPPPVSPPMLPLAR